MPIYAIGDIHGQREMLLAAHDRIAADKARNGAPDDLIVHLGDLVDRGPDSKGVLDFLIAGQAAGEPWVVLKGNHDRMFEMFLETPPRRDPVLREDLTYFDPKIGGLATVESYGVSRGRFQTLASVHRDVVKAVPDAHKTFLAGLPLFFEHGELLFVHAGIRPGVPIPEQVEQDLLWIRAGFLEDDRDFGPLVVHGHTVVEEPLHLGNRIDLDTGAGYGRPMTAAVFEGRDVWILTEEGRVPLEPI